MKKIVCLCVSLTLFVLVLIGCSNPEAEISEATVYGVTLGACPVKVSIKADGDGKVLEGKINEYLSVYDMGKLSGESGAYHKDGVPVLEEENGYARFVKVGERTFTMDGSKYICLDIEGEDKSFDTLISQKEGCKWYIDKVKKGDFDIVNGEGEPYGVPFDVYDGYRLDKKLWADKLKNGYHEGVEYEYGYKENIYKLIKHVRNHGFYDYTGEEKPSGKEGTYKVGRYDTLVNLPNFHDYMGLAKKAYDEACAVMPTDNLAN